DIVFIDFYFFFSSRRRHTRFKCDWSSDVCSSDLRDLVNAVAERAGWTPRPVRQEKTPVDGVMHGRGFAYALYVHSKFPGYGAAWSAWIADVAVNKATGDVSVTRVVAGQDSGLMINPDGVRHQVHGNVIQSTSRALMEEVSFDR